jgi:hypothetical protein
MNYYLEDAQEVQAHILHIDEQQCDELHPTRQLRAVANLATEAAKATKDSSMGKQSVRRS